jgi:hypothetical protein
MQKRGQSILGAKQAWNSNSIPPDGKNRPELGRPHSKLIYPLFNLVFRLTGLLLKAAI